MPTIQFINHASFLIDSGDVRLICDPWLDGPAFNNGWAHISETRFQYEEFKDVTHIWFSHEHPDHFSPPNLKKIPAEYRANITVLFQETIDHRVVDACRKFGFKETINLAPGKAYSIADNFRVSCSAYTFGDSWALFTVDGVKILNLNDCVIDSEKEAKKLSELTGPVDVLFTQFGYANKIGEAKDTALRKASSAEKLRRIKYQTMSWKPKVLVPFASYIRFCHEENAYMNDGVSNIRDVYEYIKGELNTSCNVFYPNDVWKYGTDWDSEPSIRKYEEDSKAAASKAPLKSTRVEAEEIQKQAKVFCGRFNKHTERYANMFSKLKVKFYCTDLDQSFLFTLKDGLVKKDINQNDCDLILSSESLMYVFKFMWGGDTLYINARYQTPPNGDISDFELLRETASVINREEEVVFPTPMEKLISRTKIRIAKMLGMQ